MVEKIRKEFGEGNNLSWFPLNKVRQQGKAAAGAFFRMALDAEDIILHYSAGKGDAVVRLANGDFK